MSQLTQKRKFKLSGSRLRNKFLIAIHLVFLIPYTSIMVWNHYRLKKDLIKNALHESQKTAQQFGISIQNYFKLSDKEAIASFLFSMKLQNQYIDEITIIDKNMKIVSSTNFDRKIIKGKVYIKAIKHSQNIIFFNLDASVPYLRTIVPIIYTKGNKFYTQFVVEQKANLRQQMETLNNNLFVILLTGGIIILSITLLVIFLTSKVMHPVRILYAAFLKVSKGDWYAEVDLTGKDEISFLGNTFNLMIQSRRHFQETMEKFIPLEFLTFLDKKDFTQVRLGESVEKEFTILFCDMRGFTTASEKMTPAQTLSFVNYFLESMAPVVRKHNGFIITYLGDALEAAFAAGDEEKALLCAREMQQTIEALNQKVMQSLMPVINIGIGLNYGKSMIGIIGEKDRLEAAIIADTVNTAARLESLNKYYNTKIIFSGSVYEQTKDFLTLKNNFRQLDLIKVKGKNKAIKIFEYF